MPFRANIIFMNTNAQLAIAEFDLPVTLMTASTRASNPLLPAETPLDVEAAWRQVQARDRQAGFFYAVTTTGVFCSPVVCEPQAAARQCAFLQHRTAGVGRRF